MSQNSYISIWTIIEETLEDQGYTKTMIAKVKGDLEKLAKAHCITGLLEKMSDEHKQELGSKLKNAQEEERQKIISEFITLHYKSEPTAKSLEDSTRHVLTEYTDHLISSFKDNDKKKKFLGQLTVGGKQKAGQTKNSG